MKKISIEYKINEPVTVDQFIELMASSTLGARPPAANDYYDHIGFTNNPRCWVLDRSSSI